MNKNKISIRIQNFRSIEDFTYVIKPFSFLFGKNGSGKTSLIKAILFLRNNILPLRLTNTIFQVTESINLGSFSNTVINNDKSKKIRFEINLRIQNESEKIDFEDIFYDDLFGNVINDYQLSQKNFFVTQKKGVHRHDNLGVKFQKINNLDCNVNVEFADDPDGNNLHLFEIINNTSKEYFRFTRKSNSRISLFPQRKFSSHFDFALDLKIEKEIFKLFKKFLLKPFFWGAVISVDDNSSYFSDFWDRTILGKDENLNNPKNTDIRIAESNMRFEQALIAHLYSVQYIQSWKKLKIYKKKFLFNHILNNMRLFRWQIPKLLREHLHVQHIPTVREVPKHYYFLNKKMFKEEDYYGIPNYLEIEFNLAEETLINQSKGNNKIRIKQIFRAIDYTLKFNNENKNGIAVITKTLRDLRLAKYIFIEKSTHTGQLKLENLEGVTFNISEGSSGLQQILPIIFYCMPFFQQIKSDFIQKVPPLIFIEQPELHLHPRLQILLLENLLSNKDIQLCFETHSEHIIRKVQLLIAQDKMKKEDVVVYYFEVVKGITKVKELQLEGNGFFREPWPDGFFDDASDLAYSLLEAQINQKK